MGNFESREEVFEIESTVLDNLADLHVEYCAIENNIDHVMQRLQVFQPFNQLLVTTSSTEQCAKDLVGNERPGRDTQTYLQPWTHSFCQRWKKWVTVPYGHDEQQKEDE